MKKTKTFSAEGLTIKLKIEGKVHEEVGKFYNALVHQINLSMQDVMNRVATEKMPNQPQKQPEGEYKCGTLEVLKNPKLRKELLQMDNQVIKKNLTTEKQPEKQEEWREEFYKKFVGSKATNPRELKGDTIWESTEYITGSPREIVDFISQLLSERTRKTKEEGEYIAYDDIVETILADDDTDILKYAQEEREKLSKLLKEKK